MARRRQSRPDSGLGLQVKVIQPSKVVPSALGNGLLVGKIVGAALTTTSGVVPLDRECLLLLYYAQALS